MLHIGPAAPPTLVDTAWQIAFRIGFPLARVWWRLSRQRHEGALVAVHIGESLLLLRSSYRAAWNLPGGTVKPHETPGAAARRELLEETGLVADQKLRPAAVACGLWEGRRDRVHFFELRLDRLPPLRLDNREITGARLVPWAGLNALPLTKPVQGYVSGHMSAMDSRQSTSRRSLSQPATGR